MIQTITILGGHGKTGEPEPVPRIDLRMGDVVSIVGPTGSGQNHLHQRHRALCRCQHPHRPAHLLQRLPRPAEYRDDPARNPIALITQHTTFLSDLPVDEFLHTHARIRCTDSGQGEAAIERTLAFANQLTGEPIARASRMTELSGGQTRALLIADATIICNTPIVLLDEVENAGIHRTRALELLHQYQKIFIFVTHDPRIALLSDYRIVMKGGCVTDVLRTDDKEQKLAAVVSRLDDLLSGLRDRIRMGERITSVEGLV